MFTKESPLAIKTLFFVILSVFLMMADARFGLRSRIHSVMAIPLEEIQFLVDFPSQAIKKSSTFLQSHLTLIRENERLKTNQLQLKAELQRLLALQSENTQLRALLQVAESVQGKALVGRILSVEMDPFIRQLTVNRGRQEGLFVGQMVLDAEGVLGQVIEVGVRTSRILLIDDPRSGVPVQVTRNGMRGIAVGDVAGGGLRLINVPQTADVLPGDTLITSGVGSSYLPGYPLGRVKSVTHDPGLQFLSIAVDPIAHLDRGDQVLFIWPQGNHST